MKFLQVHTFYQAYLDRFYGRNPALKTLSFQEQTEALVRDGFSGIHMFAPYMAEHGYECGLIIANNAYAQSKWLASNNVPLIYEQGNKVEVVRKQVEAVGPDVLYLSDPITFDSRFVRSLSCRPGLVVGWRAADIPDGTDWSEFDVMLSGLSGIRKAALELGARSAENFVPGFPEWMLSEVSSQWPVCDVVFSGSWTTGQHTRRNSYLGQIARASQSADNGFTCGFYLNSGNVVLPEEVASCNYGPRFGMDMCRVLRSGRIAVDARGDIRLKKAAGGSAIDLARNETMNMRIFEVTGCGVFLLTEYFDNLSEYFEIGKEIEIFRDEKELIEKIRYYLANPDRREQIARRGQERCLRDYSMAVRSADFDRIIKKHAVVPQDNAQACRRLLEQALKEKDSGNIEAAFTCLNRAKSLKHPTQGLDLLRAVCFAKSNLPMEAREALKEELRYFPDNVSARKMLSDLNTSYPKKIKVDVADPEFLEIYRMVSDYTMVPPKRLYSLFRLIRNVCDLDIPGNIVECGVAGGGSSALMAYLIKKYSKRPRILYAFDSFEGMPEPTDSDRLNNGILANDTGWGTGTCAAPVQSLVEICTRLGVSKIVAPVKGYFQDTLPRHLSDIGPIALLHIDGDWYESTRCVLENLYDRVVPGGLIQVDDYGYWQGCTRAVDEFKAVMGNQFNIQNIDGSGAWFNKPCVSAGSFNRGNREFIKV